MAERKLFTMAQADLDAIIARIDRARNTPLIMLQTGMPKSVQEVANDAWCELGERMGFDGMTVNPAGLDQLEFYAEPVAETQEAGDAE